MIFPFYIVVVEAWGNGGNSDNPLYPKYGTHDWIAHHALDKLDDDEKEFITNNIDAFLLGTEMPDNSELVGGLADKPYHSFLFFANKSIEKDAAGNRAQSEFERAIDYLNYGEYKLAAQSVGTMSHYIADLAVFGHVMKKESNHDEFEDDVGDLTTAYISVLNEILILDGPLNEIDAYQAAKQLAGNTTFGDGEKMRNCTWMNENYSPWIDEIGNWGNPLFFASATESINLAVNLLADVIHTISVRANPNSGIRANHIVISEVYYDASGDENLEEYIELYNPTNTEVDLSQWRVETSSKTYVLPQNSIIRGDSFFVLAKDEETFVDNYRKAPDVRDLSVSLSNSYGHITLKDGNGEEIDFVAWDQPEIGWDIKAKAGKTIQRIPVHMDTNKDSEWMSNSLQIPMAQSDLPPSPTDLTTGAIAATAVGIPSVGFYIYIHKKTKKSLRKYHCPICNVLMLEVSADLSVPEEREVKECSNGHIVKVPAFSE